MTNLSTKEAKEKLGQDHLQPGGQAIKYPTVLVPKCPCGKIPLKCPQPNNCMMEDL